jgi:hypothetical protein
VKNPAGVVRAIFVLAGSASIFVKQHSVLRKRRKGFQFLLALPCRLAYEYNCWPAELAATPP